MVKRLCLCAAAVLALSFLLPAFMPKNLAGHIPEKQQAVRLASEARAIIGPDLLGVEYSETTTTVGHRDAKMLSAAPDFPALLVQWLHDAGIGENDAVAINASGSFPTLTIASLAAVEAVGARPLLISSLGSSSWGANRPEYTWAHMEKRLSTWRPGWKSLAMSLGGGDDIALEMLEEGRKSLLEALHHAEVPHLTPATEREIMENRMHIWKDANNGELPALLVNIGGNHAFWGTRDRTFLRKEGLLLPPDGSRGDGVGALFSQAGKPVIHLLGIKNIAAYYAITLPPTDTSPLWVTPDASRISRILTFGVLMILLLVLPLFINKGKGGKLQQRPSL